MMMTAVAVEGRGNALEVGATRALFQVHPPSQPGYPYSVTSDGQRFLVNTEQAVPPPISVVMNWTALLKK